MSHVIEAIAAVTGQQSHVIAGAANIYLELSIDSLGAGQIVLELEKRTGVWIPVERMAELDTADKIAAALVKPC